MTSQPEIPATAPTETHIPDTGHFLGARNPPLFSASTPFPLGLQLPPSESGSEASTRKGSNSVVF